MPRVHGPAKKPGSNAPLGIRVCQWCGKDFAVREPSQFTCTAKHRHAFNNKRKERGAIIYDLLMVMRFDRPLASNLGIWSKLCRILSNFRAEDHAEREGRPSWRHPNQTIERRPDLLAKTILRGRKGEEK